MYTKIIYGTYVYMHSVRSCVCFVGCVFHSYTVKIITGIYHMGVSLNQGPQKPWLSILKYTTGMSLFQDDLSGDPHFGIWIYGFV